MHSVLTVARRHWFYVALPFLLVVSLAFRTSYAWGESPRIGEATAIFEWCVFVPLIHALCYRDMPLRTLALRTLALVCAGLWIAATIVPDPAESILGGAGWLRLLGMVVLGVFEGIACVAALRIAFGAAPDATILERQGVPPLLARLMLAEARFWRWVWMRLRGR